MQITTVEPGHRIKLPAEWAESLRFDRLAALEKTAEGILVRPCPPATWDEIFADRLSISARPEPAGEPESGEIEVSADDLLF